MSVSKDWRNRVQDIIDHAAYIEQMTRGMAYDDFLADLKVQLATTHCIEIMGEATRHVPPDVRARRPEVAWRFMNDMRNVLIHAYAAIDLGLVWETVSKDVPTTRERLVQFLDAEHRAQDSATDTQ